MNCTYIHQTDLNLSKLNNLELVDFFREMRLFDHETNRNSAYSNFIKVQKKTLTQDRINKIDSWSWRKILGYFPHLSHICDIEKLNCSDIANIYMKHPNVSFSLSKYNKNSVTFYSSSNLFKNNIFKFFKINITETKNQFIVKFIKYFDKFDYNEVIEHIIFKDNTLIELGFSFDLSGDEELSFKLNKDNSKATKDQLLISLNNIIKNNLFNFSDIH